LEEEDTEGEEAEEGEVLEEEEPQHYFAFSLRKRLRQRLSQLAPLRRAAGQGASSLDVAKANDLALRAAKGRAAATARQQQQQQRQSAPLRTQSD
jgi:hypothetical protein